jgi:hypothetical protein
MMLVLTAKRIGQMWLHHTGHDTTRGRSIAWLGSLPS